MSHSPNPTQHLQAVVDNWPDLQRAVTTKPHDAWPPASVNQYLRGLDEYDPADRNAPLRLHILDTARTVELALVELADQVAADVQRPIFSCAIGRGWSDEIHRAAVLLAAKDSADQRRWQYHGTRTAPQAATWLTTRLTGEDGPFRPLNDLHRARITTIAADAAERVSHALGTGRRTHPLTQPCPHCREEQLQIQGGDGQPPAVKCTACGRTWREPETA